MCGDAEDDTLVLHELTKVCITLQMHFVLAAFLLLWHAMTVENHFYLQIYKRSFSKVTAVEDLCLGVGKGEVGISLTILTIIDKYGLVLSSVAKVSMNKIAL